MSVAAIFCFFIVGCNTNSNNSIKEVPFNEQYLVGKWKFEKGFLTFLPSKSYILKQIEDGKEYYGTWEIEERVVYFRGETAEDKFQSIDVLAPTKETFDAEITTKGHKWELLHFHRVENGKSSLGKQD